MKKINNINLILKCKSGFNLNKNNIKKGIKKILEEEKKQNFDINIIFINNQNIKEINLEYRSKNYPTDVISFPVENSKKMVRGDIFISLEKVKENAVKYGEKFKNELKKIIVHGVLHLIGYDHVKKNQKEKMYIKQENYIKFLKGTI